MPAGDIHESHPDAVTPLDPELIQVGDAVGQRQHHDLDPVVGGHPAARSGQIRLLDPDARSDYLRSSAKGMRH
jgi:hypothetical protein